MNQNFLHTLLYLAGYCISNNIITMSNNNNKSTSYYNDTNMVANVLPCVAALKVTDCEISSIQTETPPANNKTCSVCFYFHFFVLFCLFWCSYLHSIIICDNNMLKKFIIFWFWCGLRVYLVSVMLMLLLHSIMIICDNSNDTSRQYTKHDKNFLLLVYLCWMLWYYSVDT